MKEPPGHCRFWESCPEKLSTHLLVQLSHTLNPGEQITVLFTCPQWLPPTLTEPVTFYTWLNTEGILPQIPKIKGTDLYSHFYKASHIWDGLTIISYWTTKNPIWRKEISLIHPPLMLVWNTCMGHVRRIILTKRDKFNMVLNFTGWTSFEDHFQKQQSKCLCCGHKHLQDE